MEVSELNTTQTELTTEQKKVIEDLLAFLEVDSLSELEDGNLIAEMLLNGQNLGEWKCFTTDINEA